MTARDPLDDRLRTMAAQAGEQAGPLPSGADIRRTARQRTQVRSAVAGVVSAAIVVAAAGTALAIANNDDTAGVTTPLASPSSPRPSADAKRYPPEARVTAGARVWGVYTEVTAPPSSPDHAGGHAAVERAGLRARGYHPSSGEIRCDAGAAEQLGVAKDSVSVAVYFESRAAAARFASSYEADGGTVAGIAHVTIGCAD